MSTVNRLMEQKNELARELIQCKAEIERLKGLIGMLYRQYIQDTNTSPAVISNDWNKFKTDNKL